MLEMEVSKLKEQCQELARKFESVKATIKLECYRDETKVRNDMKPMRID